MKEDSRATSSEQMTAPPPAAQVPAGWRPGPFEHERLAWISTAAYSPNAGAVRGRSGAGLRRHAVSRRVRPFHQGTLVDRLRMPSARMMDKWARWWNSACTPPSEVGGAEALAEAGEVFSAGRVGRQPCVGEGQQAGGNRWRASGFPRVGFVADGVINSSWLISHT